ncbi:MAG: hypothetical protein CENE_00743 [Candidatus Celerinatantimonas neptuna]|nr:MAG: hypothetical protein CENE_00743 [Candidatus Celerinatantimonas neptuna]
MQLHYQAEILIIRDLDSRMVDHLSDTTLDIFHRMYLAVQERFLLINTFLLPKKPFSASVNHSVWLCYGFKYGNEWAGYILLIPGEDTQGKIANVF